MLLFIWLLWALVVTLELLVVACGISFPQQGSNLGLLHRRWILYHLATREAFIKGISSLEGIEIKTQAGANHQSQECQEHRLKLKTTKEVIREYK